MYQVSQLVEMQQGLLYGLSSVLQVTYLAMNQLENILCYLLVLLCHHTVACEEHLRHHIERQCIDYNKQIFALDQVVYYLFHVLHV